MDRPDRGRVQTPLCFVVFFFVFPLRFFRLLFFSPFSSRYFAPTTTLKLACAALKLNLCTRSLRTESTKLAHEDAEKGMGELLTLWLLLASFRQSIPGMHGESPNRSLSSFRIARLSSP